MLLFENTYPMPERYRLVPEGKILEPFGFTERNSLNRGVFFGRKGQLVYNLYSPINADSFSFNPIKRILTLHENTFGVDIRIYGIKTLALSFRERHISRGSFIGTASEIRDLRPGVYVECIISQESMKNTLQAHYDISQEKIEKDYIRMWSFSQDIDYISMKQDINALKRREKIREINPYYIIQRDSPRKPYLCFMNYSALFF